MAQMKSLTFPRVESRGNWNAHALLAGLQKGKTSLDSLVTSHEVKWPSSSTPGRFTKRKPSVCPHSTVRSNVRTSLAVIAKHCKLPKCPSAGGRVSTLWRTHPMEHWAAFVWSLSRVWLSCDPMDCSPLGSSVHRISQARILGWAVMSSSRDLPDPGVGPMSPALAGGFFTIWATRGASPGNPTQQ